MEEHAAGIADFEPLSTAEQLLLRACRRGDIAKIGLKRPDAASPAVAVRAGLLAFLVRGGGEGARVRGGRIELIGAWIEGVLDLAGADVPVTPWLYRCAFESAPRLERSRFAGSLGLPGCALPALNAQEIRVAGDLSLNAGCTIAGELRLVRARIGGDLDLRRSHLGGADSADARRAAPARALVADGAHVGGDLRLDEGFAAIGEVRAAGARIDGDVRLQRARLTGHVDAAGARQVALRLDRAEIAGDLVLDGGFAAAGAVRLARARIGGDLDASGAEFDTAGDATWGDHASLLLERAEVGGTLRMRRLASPAGGVSLLDARAGTLADDTTTWGQDLVLDGFEYRRFGEGAPRDAATRLEWLQQQVPEHLGKDFRPQPWRQLAAVLRASGLDHEAQRIAMAYERQRRRVGRVGAGLPASRRWLARTGHALWGALAGYGHRPGRIVVALLAVWLAGAGVFALAAGHHALAATSPPAAAGGFDPWLYSLDVLLPLVDLGAERDWRPVASAAAGAWSAVARGCAVAEALFGWLALLVLLVSLVRRPGAGGAMDEASSNGGFK